MTDTRLPEQWLNNPKFDELSDTAWRVFTGGLMWSNSNATDGAIPSRYLRMLHPDGEKPNAIQELVAAGLWGESNGNYQVLDWVGLGQSTAAEVEERKEANRKRAQTYRDREAAKKASQKITSEAPRGASRDATPNVGQDSDRTGQEQEQLQMNVLQKEIEKGIVGWSAAIPGRPSEYSDPGYCRLCGGPLPCQKEHSETELARGRRAR